MVRNDIVELDEGTQGGNGKQSACCSVCGNKGRSANPQQRQHLLKIKDDPIKVREGKHGRTHIQRKKQKQVPLMLSPSTPIC